MPAENLAADDAEHLTLQEAADELGVHYMTAYRYVRSGRLQAVKAEGTWRVTRADLDAFRSDGPAPRVGRRIPIETRRDALRQRMLAGDESGAWSVIQDALQGSVVPADVLRLLVLPALHEVGESWARGDTDVAEEHQATAVARRMVSRLGPHFAVRGQPIGSVVVGGAPHERHEVGLAIMSDLLRGRNVHAVELGGDVPAASFRRAVEIADRPLAVAVGVAAEAGAAQVASVVEALEGTNIPIIIGGAEASEELAAATGTTYFASIDDAIDAIVEMSPR